MNFHLSCFFNEKTEKVLLKPAYWSSQRKELNFDTECHIPHGLQLFNSRKQSEIINFLSFDKGLFF